MSSVGPGDYHSRIFEIQHMLATDFGEWTHCICKLHTFADRANMFQAKASNLRGKTSSIQTGGKWRILNVSHPVVLVCNNNNNNNNNRDLRFKTEIVVINTVYYNYTQYFYRCDTTALKKIKLGRNMLPCSLTVFRLFFGVKAKVILYTTWRHRVEVEVQRH